MWHVWGKDELLYNLIGLPLVRGDLDAVRQLTLNYFVGNPSSRGLERLMWEWWWRVGLQ